MANENAKTENDRTRINADLKGFFICFFKLIFKF